MMAPTHKDIQNAVAQYIYNALSLRIQLLTNATGLAFCH